MLNKIIDTNKGCYIIGVTGGSGGGKTSTCKLIQSRLLSYDTSKLVTLLSMDSFYLPTTKNQNNNFDHPDSFDWDLLFDILKQLKMGKSVSIPVYDFISHSRIGFETVEASGCIIFEGILSLYDAKVRDLLDVMIFVDTPADIRLIRRLRRDITERGRSIESVLTQCENTVIPSYDQFIEPTKKYADLIIPRGKTNITAIVTMVNHINNVIK